MYERYRQVICQSPRRQCTFVAAPAQHSIPAGMNQTLRRSSRVAAESALLVYMQAALVNTDDTNKAKQVSFDDIRDLVLEAGKRIDDVKRSVMADFEMLLSKSASCRSKGKMPLAPAVSPSCATTPAKNKHCETVGRRPQLLVVTCTHQAIVYHSHPAGPHHCPTLAKIVHKVIIALPSLLAQRPDIRHCPHCFTDVHHMFTFITATPAPAPPLPVPVPVRLNGMLAIKDRSRKRSSSDAGLRDNR